MSRLFHPKDQKKSRDTSKPMSMWGLAWERFKRNKVALAGLFIVGYMIFMALFASFIAPFGPFSTAYQRGELEGLPPSWTHPFGTDLLGQDIFSRIVWGAQGELIVGFGAAALTMLISILVGMTAGYYGHYVDEFLMRFTEVFLVLPIFLVILVLMEVFTKLFPGGVSGLGVIILLLGIFGWPGNARIIRGEILQTREFDFIQASKCLGASGRRILFRHILPNVLYLVIVLTTLSVAGNILSEAGLSFLGFGAPNSITWGQMLADPEDEMLNGHWWAVIFPGVFISLLVLGLNLLGNGLRDALDPRLRE